MSPTNKNTKLAEQIKHVHVEQLKKLQAKHQQDTDLLEDTRLFAKQRSVIEKEYAQALVKLGEAFLQKRKFPPPPDVKSTEHKIIMAVWKTVLEETIRVGKTRLNAAESYLQDISEPAKPLRTNKVHIAKKIFEQASATQKDVAASILELNKAYKVYSEDEHVAHESRVKAADADHKVKNKSTGIFTSMAKLQQKSVKLNTQKETSETKSTSARNDYILNLASSNAHLNHYFNHILPELMKTLDGELYEKVSEFFMTSAKAELECCGLTQECFMRILADSTMVSREYNLQCFLKENTMFTEVLQFDYDPQDNDQVTKVCMDYGAGEAVDKEAGDCAQRLATHNKTIRSCNCQMQELQDMKDTANGSKNMSESSDGGGKEKEKEKEKASTPSDPDARMEEIRLILRGAMTEQVKLEAKVDALRQGGVEIDSLVESAETEMMKVEEAEEALTSTKRSTHSRSSSKGGDSHKSRPQSEAIETAQSTPSASITTTPAAAASASASASAPTDSTYINYQEEDYIDEAFEDTVAAGGGGRGGRGVPGDSGYSSGRVFPMKAYALYEFHASNQDELSILENEALLITGVGDSTGWLKARRDNGEVGFIPENYVQPYDETAAAAAGVVDPNEVNVDSGDAPGTAGWDPTQNVWGAESSAPTSAGYTSGDTSAFDSVPPSTGYDSSSVPLSAGFDSSAPPSSAGHDSTGAAGADGMAMDQEVEQASAQHHLMPPGPGVWARALYDYEATCDEELTFSEGTLLQILRREDATSGVDDGWWEGQINGRIGVFPSLVVEEMTGQQLQQDALSPGDRPGPPSFTPPEPGPPPPQIEVHDPTPNEEHASPLANGTSSFSSSTTTSVAAAAASSSPSSSLSAYSSRSSSNYGVCNLYQYNGSHRHESTV